MMTKITTILLSIIDKTSYFTESKNQNLWSRHLFLEGYKCRVEI